MHTKINYLLNLIFILSHIFVEFCSMFEFDYKGNQAMNL